MTRRTTVHDLLSQKGRRKWLQIHVDNVAEAAAAVEAGITILSCEPDHHFEDIRAAVPSAFLSVGMPHGAVASPDEAVRLGFAMITCGADAVYCSHSPYFIEAMAREGIPVTGHVGLVPNKATWTNFRAIGRTPEEALRVVQNVKDLESAGAAAVEVEVVPVSLADHITRLTSMITMGMGCGSVCDTIVSVLDGCAGNQCRSLPASFQEVRRLPTARSRASTRRVDGFKVFVDDVANGGYPEAHHQVDMEDGAFEKFRQISDELGG